MMKKRTQKLISVLLSLMMLLSLLPTVAFAAEPESITFVKVSDVTVPVIGATPDFDITLTGEGVALYEYDEDEWEAITWDKFDPETGEWEPMDEDTPFGAGLYCLGVALESEAGYEFTDATEFYYNDYKLPEFDGSYESNYERWDGGADIYLYFTLEESAFAVTVTDGVASWTAVEGADRYKWTLAANTIGGSVDLGEERSIDLNETLFYYGKSSGTYSFTVQAFNGDEPVSEEVSAEYAYTTTHAHDWADEWTRTDTHHWHECLNDGCGITNDALKLGFGQHDFVDNVCTGCGKTVSLAAAPTITITDGIASWTPVEGAWSYKWGLAANTMGGWAAPGATINLREWLAGKEDGTYTFTVQAFANNSTPMSEKASVDYDYTTTVIIGSIHITGITAPEDGSSPYTGLDEITTDTPGLEITSKYWYRDSSLQNYPFEAGYTYNLTIHFEVAEGYEFSDSVTVDHDLPDGTFSGKNLTIDTPWISIDYTVPSAESTATTINELSATVTEPIAGNPPSLEAVAGGEGYTVVVEWADTAEDTVLYPEDGDTFEAGKQYTVTVVFNAKPGYVFAEGASVEINGTPAEEKVVSETFAWGDLTFTAADPPAPTTISELSATVTEPVAGESISFEAIAGGEGYTVTVEWEDDDRQIYPEDDAKFEAGKQYFLAVEFSAKPGYVFAEDASVVINDKTPERKEVEETSAYGLLTFDLAAPVETYTVTFVTEHGEAPSQQTITAGGKVREPVAPTADGWTFNGWFADGSTSAWDFETDTVNADITLTASWTENEPEAQTATIVVKKWDSNQQPLAGATFTLTLPGSIQPAHTEVSGEDGLVTFTDVEDGIYTLEETDAPAGYIINDDTWSFVVRGGVVSDAMGAPYDNNNPLTVINEPAPAPELPDIVVWKTDGGQNYVAGATFTLTEERATTPVDTVTSDENGKILFEDVADGIYILAETAAPAGYIPTDLIYKFIVDEGEVYIVENDDPMVYEGQLSIINEPLVTFTLPITKVVAKGGTVAPVQQTFTFEIKEFGNSNFDVSAATILENTITTNGVGSFNGVLKFSLAARDAEDILSEGLIIVEKNDGAANWTYDANEWEAFANYSRATSGGQWVFRNDDIAPNGAERATFTNTYTKNDSGGGGSSAPSRPVLNKEDHVAFMQGYPDGTFGTKKNITRAEAAVMFARLITEKMDADKTYTNTFTDVDSDAWYYNYIGYMQKFGIINGYEDGSFRPDASITRAEFAAIACRFEELTKGEAKFSDVTEDHWAYDYINFAAARGWVTGYEDGTFKPGAFITREEVVAVTCRLLERSADQDYVEENIDSLKRVYSDVTKSDWSYWYVIEASNGHDYTKKADKETWSNLLK